MTGNRCYIAFLTEIEPAESREQQTAARGQEHCAAEPSPVSRTKDKKKGEKKNEN